MNAPTPAEPTEGAVFVYGEQLKGLCGWEFRYASHHNFVQVAGGDWSIYARTLVEARPKPEPMVAVMLPQRAVEHLGAGDEYVNVPEHLAAIRSIEEACRDALKAQGAR